MGQIASQASQVVVDQGPAAQMMRTQTRGTQALAVMQPRVIRAVEAAAIQEASLLGDSAFYGWGAGKDRVEGPAWPLTKSLMRIYGNCSLDMEPVQELSDGWVFTARAVDHETGYSISRQFRQSKRWTVHGKFDDARKEDIRFQIGQSKALRNVALAFLPDWLVDRAMDTAKGNVKAQIIAAVEKHGLDQVIARAVERAKAIGCDEARLLAAMGRSALPAITIEDLIIIYGGVRAIEKGTDTLDEVFPLPVKQAGDIGPQTSVLNDALNKVTGKAAPATAPAPAPLVTDEELAAAASKTKKFADEIEEVKRKAAEPEQADDEPPFEGQKNAPDPVESQYEEQQKTPAEKAKARRGSEKKATTPPPAAQSQPPNKPKQRFDINGNPID